MPGFSPYDIFRHYQTLYTNRISSLPVVILMTHSACNCRCVMCDIWKDNKNLKQLSENDISALLSTLKKFGTKEVVMSGGEALLNENFFRLCEMLKGIGVKITLLSTGLTLKKNAEQIVRHIDQLIISLDGDEETHNRIRNIPDAFQKMKEGIQQLRSLSPKFPVSGRSVIHRLNFRKWAGIVESAKILELDSISFLPADVSSHAFNREQAWGMERQSELLIPENELGELQEVIMTLFRQFGSEFKKKFIAESEDKIQKIHAYYAASLGLNPYPYKKCNAPWVSTVIEADGTVRPCFFHESIGNIRENTLMEILNGEKGLNFRKNLNMDKNETCVKCVCYLNLRPLSKFL